MSSNMSDRKPDLRFAMIALELTTEVDLPPVLEVADPDVLIVDADGPRCPRCNLRAFEPRTDNRTNAGSLTLMTATVAVCLGCLDNPALMIPADAVLVTSPYRCERCVVQTQVTMTMTDVNLHCTNCKALTPHVRDDVRKLRELGIEAIRDLNESNRAPFKKASTPIKVRRSVYVNEEDYEYISDNHPALVNSIYAMRSILQLNDFDEYAEARASLNQKRIAAGDFPKNSNRRQTGRTTRGIVELLARYYLIGKDPVVLVLGSSSKVDDYLRKEVRRTCVRLGRTEALSIKPLIYYSDLLGMLAVDGLKPPRGCILYVDHSFYEGSRYSNLMFK